MTDGPGLMWERPAMRPAECRTCGRLTTRPVYCETCTAVFDELRQLTVASRTEHPHRVVTLPPGR